MTTKKYLSDYPELMVEWDWEKNNLEELYPNKISRASRKYKPYWICPRGHSYRSEAFRRTDNRGCNICSGKSVVVGVNNLSFTDPEVVRYLENPLDGETYSRGSVRKVPWKCDLGHTTYARISHRVSGTGCRICTNQEVLVGFNDLWTTDPLLAVELLDQDLGYKVVEHSTKKVHWLCKRNHIYSVTVTSRKMSGSECPVCTSRITKPEIALLSMIDGSEGQYSYRHDDGIFFPDVFVEKNDLFIEYDGAKYHFDKVHGDTDKTELLLRNGHKVVRIRETYNKDYPLTLLPISHENLLQIPVKYNRDMKHIAPAWEQIQEWL